MRGSFVASGSSAIAPVSRKTSCVRPRVGSRLRPNSFSRDAPRTSPPTFRAPSCQSARLRRRPMAAEEPLPATAGSLTCVPPPLNLPPAVKTRPAGRGIRFRRSSRNLDTASEQSSRETELEPAAEGQAATAEGAAAGQSPCGGSGTARRRRGAGGASPATPGEEDSHHRLMWRPRRAICLLWLLIGLGAAGPFRPGIRSPTGARRPWRAAG